MDSRLKRVVEYAAEDRDGTHLRKRRDTISYHQMLWKDAIIPYVIDSSVGMCIHYHLYQILLFLFNVSWKGTCGGGAVPTKEGERPDVFLENAYISFCIIKMLYEY